ncbi:MAG: hypothetical protein QM689_01550 [Oscillospiraceae bacterium]
MRLLKDGLMNASMEFTNADNELLEAGDLFEVKQMRYQDNIENLLDRLKKPEVSKFVNEYIKDYKISSENEIVKLYLSEDGRQISTERIRNNGIYDKSADCTECEFYLPSGYRVDQRNGRTRVVNQQGEAVFFRPKNGEPVLYNPDERYTFTILQHADRSQGWTKPSNDLSVSKPPPIIRANKSRGR